MKIRPEIISIFKQMPFAVGIVTIKEEKSLPNSLLNHAIEIKIDDHDAPQKCYCCNETNTNYCWNCETATCDNHAVAIYFKPLINTLCLDCTKELFKLLEKN